MSHRLILSRVISPGPEYCFIGVNPSTADDETDDATVRKWIGFVTRWGGGSFVVVNLFTKRATDVKELATAYRPSSGSNDGVIQHSIGMADVVIPCWGRASKLPPKLRPRIDRVNQLIPATAMCFGFTQDGQPKHPLMLSYDTQLVRYKP